MWPRLGLAAVLVLGMTGCVPGISSGPAPGPNPSPSDCPTYSEAPALARDEVLGVQVLHVETTVVIELHQRDIVSSTAQAWTFDLKSPSDAWTVDIDRTRKHHRTRTWVDLSVDEPVPSVDPGGCGIVGTITTTTTCPGLRADVAPDDDLVQVVIPRQCVGAPEWVRVGAMVWDRDHAATYSSPALGPRVPVR